MERKVQCGLSRNSGFLREPYLQSWNLGTIPHGPGSGPQSGDGSAEPQGSEEHSKEAPCRLRRNCLCIQGTGSNRVWQKVRLIPGAEQVLCGGQSLSTVRASPALPSAPPATSVRALPQSAFRGGMVDRIYLRHALSSQNV